MAALDKVRIVVVGDAGVGKTSLVHLIAHGRPINNPYWTIGCSVEVKLHDYKAGTPQEKTYFIELLDVGGSQAHCNSRKIFYNNIHGIILVHDLTNRKSHQNLRKWLSEIMNKDNKNSNNTDCDAEEFVGCSSPVLVIGTKLDQLSSKPEVASRISRIAEECGADEIKLTRYEHWYYNTGLYTVEAPLSRHRKLCQAEPIF